MTKRLWAAALCTVLAACGSSEAGNAAAGRSFTYGDPQPYGSEAAAVTNGLAGFVSGSAPDAMGLTSVNAATVLGSDGFTSMPSMLVADARAQALRAAASPRAISGEFDNPACYSETDTGATFNDCTITVSVADPEYKIHLNGSGSFSQTGPDSGTLKWNFDVTAVYVGDGVSMNLAFSYDGDLQGSSSHLAGSVLSSIRATANAGGRTAQVGLDESLAIDVSLADTCSTHVTGGFLEAKRVWTARPSADDLWRDVAAKVTWTGCGQATIQWSTS